MVSLNDRHDRIMSFLDGGYIYKSLKSLGKKLNTDETLSLIKRAIDKIPGRNDSRRIYYYNALPPIHSDDILRRKIDYLIKQMEDKRSRPVKEIQSEICSLRVSGMAESEIMKKLSLTKDEYDAQKELHKARLQMKYYEIMQYRGAKVILNKLKRDKPGEYRQKGVDVYIASDLLSLAFENAYDIAMLVSGDSDFIEVIDKVRERGKLVFLASFENGKSYDLQKSCDGFISLDKILSASSPAVSAKSLKPTTT